VRIWIVNPFDEPPGEGVTELRYATLSRVLAARGHEVTWWTADWSHTHKRFRKLDETILPNLGYQIRLVKVRSYQRNLGMRRLLSHRDFGRGLRQIAEKEIQEGHLQKPEIIIFSLPPLGIFEVLSPWKARWGTVFVLDLMDLWPENFEQLFPVGTRWLSGILLQPFRRSAGKAFHGADRIAAAGKTYLNAARDYGVKSPLHLCYHGTDLGRFSADPGTRMRGSEKPLEAVHVGAMERGYDLETAIDCAAKWKETGKRPWRLNLVGKGTRMQGLMKRCQEAGLSDEHVRWHGYLEATELVHLLSGMDAGLVLNRSRSFVSCPYKAAEYAATGLPMINCLQGEFSGLLREWNAGLDYEEGSVRSLLDVFQRLADSPGSLNSYSQGSRRMAERLFDRQSTYAAFADWILE